jgi:uncharacterized damage-inducible protein DinB
MAKSARSRSSKKSGKSAKKSARKSARKPAARAAARSSRKSAAKSSTKRPHALLFPDLESELATTRRMLERVPNGNEDWRPHAKSRTLGELASHLAQLPGFGLMMATSDEFDGLSPRPPEPKFMTNAERVKMFDDLSAQLLNVLQNMSWERASAPWTLRLGDKVFIDSPRSDVLRSAFVTHSAHHRAQLGVYLRMLETPVPWSYGKSADEEPPQVAL